VSDEGRGSRDGFPAPISTATLPPEGPRISAFAKATADRSDFGFPSDFFRPSPFALRPSPLLLSFFKHRAQIQSLLLTNEGPTAPQTHRPTLGKALALVAAGGPRIPRDIHTMKTGYLIDMDGVIYREKQLIPGAREFVEALIAKGAPFIFLTNNSAPTPEDLSVRLGHLGIPGLSSRHFYTSALNTADFLSETQPSCTVFVIGEGGLLAALHERKIASDALHPSYVVVGEGDASL